MSNIAKLEFAALEVTGKNYMPWTIDVTMHLQSMGIPDTINANNQCSKQDKARAQVFLCKHIDQMLKFEYLDITDPSDLWSRLKDRFDHQREVILPNARDEWRTLRFQHFKKVNDYNSALFRIVSQLKYCGQNITDEDMLEKTYSTFHASNITLQQQYRLQRFTKYSELNICLLVAEQNNELLMKNHESRPTGSIALPEANAINTNGPRNNSHGRGRGRGRGRGFGRGNFGRNQSNDQNYNSGHGRGNSYNRGHGRKSNNYHAPPRDNGQPQNKAKVARHDDGTSQNHDSCYRCGSTGHWSRTCRTPKHLCELYQASLKVKGKEANLIDNVELDNIEFDNVEFENTQLNALDFCNDVENIE